MIEAWNFPSFLILFSWIWRNILWCKVIKHLFWNFFQDFFSQCFHIVAVLSIFYELDYVSFLILICFSGVKGLVVSVKFIHLTEICWYRTNTYNDDRNRKATSSNKFINSLLVVKDDTISQDKQHMVFLVNLWKLLIAMFTLADDVVQYFLHFTGTRQRTFLKSILVTLNDIWNALNFRIEDVTIHSKAMWDVWSLNSLNFWHLATKGIERKVLIGVILFKNSSNLLDSIDVLVLCQVQVMQRIWIGDRSIGWCHINSNLQANFTSSENIIEERMVTFDNNVNKVEADVILVCENLNCMGRRLWGCNKISVENLCWANLLMVSHIIVHVHVH